MENTFEAHGLPDLEPCEQEAPCQIGGEVMEQEPPKTQAAPQAEEVPTRDRKAPGKWRAAEKRRAELEERLAVIKEQERRQRNSLLIQSGLMFITLLELASQEQRDTLYNIIMENTAEGQQERAHDVFSWAEENALKRLAKKGKGVA